MLKGINQKSDGLLRSIKDYGCLFLCFAESSPIVFSGKEGIKALNSTWEKAVDESCIKDDVIINHNKIAQMFCIPLRYDDKHHDAGETIPDNVKMIFGEFKWKQSHFVILDRNKDVVFDSYGQSNTVKNGALSTMRWYYAD